MKDLFRKESFDICDANHLPPSPKLTIAQQTFNWYMNPIKLLTDCEQQLGSSFTLHLDPLGTHVFFANPETVAKILKADPVIHYETNDREFMLPLMGPYSLFLLHGEQHIERRRILSPPFHANKISHYGETIRALTLQACQRWQLNKPVKLADYLFELSLDIILNIIFGLSETTSAETIKQLIKQILKITHTGAIFATSVTGNSAITKMQENFNANKQQLDKLLLDLISQKKDSENSGTDILSMLIKCRDENGEYLSATEVKDHLMTLLIAGHETTATAIGWAIYWILANPTVKVRLTESLTDDTNINSIANNNYLHAVCQETLRIIPVIAFVSRTLKVSVEVENYKLAKGLNISIPIYLIHRNSTIYPNPDIFNPERFLEKKFSFNEYLPFGGGARICIGMGLALYQMKIVLATILSYFDITLENEIGVKTIRKSMIIAPAEDVKVILKNKTNQGY